MSESTMASMMLVILPATPTGKRTADAGLGRNGEVTFVCVCCIT